MTASAPAGLSRPLLTLEESVRAHVSPGQTVYLGNFGAQLFCVGHEMVRQRIRNVAAVMGSGGILMDQLLGAGVLGSVTFAHCWSPVGPAPAHAFRRSTQGQDTGPAFQELSLGMLTAALSAGAWNVPFMPVPDLSETGYFEEGRARGALAPVSCALGTTWAVRAIVPDVAFLHVDMADADGNGVVRGPLADVLLAAQAARAVVLVAEDLCSHDAVLAAGISIPGALVDAVVHHPGAVWPDGAAGRYARDVTAYEDYVQAARSSAGLAQWLRENVLTDGAFGT